MAQQDHIDSGQPIDDIISCDSPAADAAASSVMPSTAEGNSAPATSGVPGLDQDDPSANTVETTHVATHTSGTSFTVRPSVGALQRPLSDPIIKIAADAVTTQAMFNDTTPSIARMAAEAVKNAACFDLPRIPLPCFPVLYDSAFLKMLNESMASYRTTLASLAPSLHESLQWRQLIQSVSVSHRLLITQQVGLLRDALQQHTTFLSTVMANAVKFSDITASVSQSLRAFNWQQLFPNLKQLKKLYRDGLLASFLYADLWPAPSMPPALLDKIAQLAHGDDRRPVVLAVWNHYARHDHAALEQAIASWNDDPEYAARQHIFADALWGHRAKRYTLTIPTLLAQVEGIAGDFVRASTRTSPAPKLGKSGQVVRHAVEVAGNAGIADPDEAEILHIVLVDAVIEHVQNVSFQNTDFAAQYGEIRERRTLNRHGTLHGIQINYPSAMNSLRCFLLLDALYALRKHARRAASAQTAGVTP